MTSEEILVATVVKNWSLTMSRVKNTLANLSDEEFEREVVPGRNRVRYLVGHLAAFQDRLIELIGLGERRHPELDIFIEQPDRSFQDTFSRTELVQIFSDLTDLIEAAVPSLRASDWLKAHAAVSEEDFARDPFRNRLAVLDNRMGHAALHFGQIRLALASSPRR
jgi:hypothetical protein